MLDDELKAFYLQSLPSRIQALREALVQLDCGEVSAESTIRRLCHSLKGTGATYGFPEVTTVAGIAEHATTEQLSGQATLLAELLERILSEHGAGGDEETVLIVSPDADTIRIIRHTLAGMRVRLRTASSMAEAEPILDDSDFSICLLGLVLPDGDGRNLLLKIRSRAALATMPVIVLTGLTNPSVNAECLALGADAVLSKPYEPNLLLATISSHLQRSRREARESRLDLLTGVGNRAAFIESFGRQRGISQRTGEPFSVGIYDLDRFKDVNDTYGHVMGDEVLKTTARTVQSSLRSSDFVARWGGEEFVVFFPNSTSQGAKRALEKALEAVRETSFRTEKGESFRITFSAGIVDVDLAASANDNVDAADRILYLAKSGGRNRVLCSEDAADTSANRPRILIVEDDNVIATATRKRLEQIGFTVSHFTTGEEAIQTLETGYSLAVLDVNLPGMSGFEILRQIRGHAATRSLPVMMLTAVGEEQVIVDAFEMGADDYMVKPFSAPELGARVNRLLRRR